MKDWCVVYGEYNLEQAHALDKITAYVQNKIPYVFATLKADCVNDDLLANNNAIIIGTPDNNKFIKKLISDNVITIPSEEESYTYAVLDDIFGKETQTIVVAGNDGKGVLYGASDLINEYFSLASFFIKEGSSREFDVFALNYHYILDEPFSEKRMPTIIKSSSPSISERGIWTWAHCIYDYQKFFENMATLKLNKIVMWTDELPINAKEVVSYAHSLGIKVIWGYAWGWDNKKVSTDFLKEENFDAWANTILDKYEQEFMPTGADGIYFQSFTETYSDKLDGLVIADVVTTLVNRVSEKFYKKYPDIEIQFGLHGSSVKEHLNYIAKVNDKMKITWEDMGAFPFCYNPAGVSDFPEMISYVKKASMLRGNDDKFGAVFKGMTKLDWTTFVHHKGRYVLGRSDKAFIKAKTKKCEDMWKLINSQWLKNASYVKETLDELRSLKGKNLEIQALVEDGIFEEKIFFAVALYAELLWDANSNVNNIISMVSAKPCVSFANSWLV